MIDLEGANVYFQTRTVWANWREYSQEQQEGAITQAKRDLARAVRRPMNENEPPYVDGDETRDEYAVYEQAYFALVRDANPCGAAGNPIPSPDDPPQENWRENVTGDGFGKWSKEALHWLGNRIMTEILC